MSTVPSSHRPNPLLALLGPTLVNKEGKESDTISLCESKKAIILYFSAHWCPPCRAFTPVLSKAYEEYREKVGDDNDAELVFVSSDQDAEHFDEYHREMSFLAVPFDRSRSEMLGERFGVAGIPSLVVIDAGGKPLHEGESVDLRGLISSHGAAAFPLTRERLAELEDEAEEKRKEVLEKIGNGTLECPINAPNGEEVTLSQMLSNNDHVGLLLGDGDTDDPSYAVVEQTIEALNDKKAGTFEVVYVGWSLYNPEESNHAPLAKKYHSVLDISEELRSALRHVGGSSVSSAPSLIVLRRGTGVCTIDGTCEPEDISVLVTIDPGLRRIRVGTKAYPWSDADMERLEVEKKVRAEALRSRLPNFSFLKGDEGEDLVVSKDGERASVDTLAALGNDAVLGVYFSAHWCPPCQSFTPKLVECYEVLKAAGKKFEVVFVSSDEDAEVFKEYYNSMATTKGDQWLALDYEQREFANELSGIFNVCGIPTLVLLKADGTIVTTEGREAMLQHGAEYFPWDEAMIEKAKADAIQKEKESEEEQKVSGKIVIKRLRGVPGAVAHNVSSSKLKFDSFSTAGAPTHTVKSGVMYYEVELLAVDGIAQIGFSLADGMPVIDEACGDGVGDDAKSWGFDGSREVKWHDGETTWPVEWSVGDVLGLAANIDDGKIAVSMNGNWEEAGCGVMFENDAIKSGVFPCISGDGYELRYVFDGTKHAMPPADMWSQGTKE